MGLASAELPRVVGELATTSTSSTGRIKVPLSAEHMRTTRLRDRSPAVGKASLRYSSVLRRLAATSGSRQGAAHSELVGVDLQVVRSRERDALL